MGYLEANRQTFIYALVDPETNSVFYVGQSYNPRKRLAEHIYFSKKFEPGKDHHTAVQLRIKSILERGQKPTMQILEETTGQYANQREEHWRQHHLGENITLTNNPNPIHREYPYEELLEKYKKARDERQELLVLFSLFMRPVAMTGSRYEWVVKFMRKHICTGFAEKE